MNFLEKISSGFKRKSSDWDLNGNRFYQEYIIERGVRPKGKPFQVAAVLAAGFRIAEGVAAMPIIHGKKEYKDGLVVKTPNYDSELTDVLTNRANEFMTSIEFIENLTLKAIFTGKGQAFIHRRKGKRLELIPIDEPLVAQQDQDTGRVTYSGTIKGVGEVSNLSRSKLIEITQPRYQPLEGIDVTTELKTVIELSLAQHGRMLDDATLKKVKGILTFDGEIGVKAAQKVQSELREKLPNVPILDAGAKYNELMQTAAELQLLQARGFVIEDIARMLGIHPLLLSHDGAGQSLTRISDVLDYHVQITLGPWVRRWEAALKFSLLKSNEYIDFDEAQYFRMNLSDRAIQSAQSLGSGGGQPWNTVNEVRQSYGLNPIEGGDVLVSQASAEDVMAEVDLATVAT